MNENNPKVNHLSNCGRRYDREFKQQAVALIQNGRPLSEVARDLNVSVWSLRRWENLLARGNSLGEPKTLAAESPLQRELRHLRQENDYLRCQRDILKKALAIVSAQTPNRAIRL
jgi:transposase-like protein